MALYTPFMEKVGSTLGASMARTGRAELAGSAYMGDQNAMQELMRVDPDLGIQIQERQRMSQQKQVQGDTAALKKEQEKRKIYMGNRKLMDNIFKEAAKLDDYDQSLAYVQRRFDEASDILGEHADASGFTQEVYAQVKKVFGAEKSGASSPFSKIDPGDYTSDSLKQFQEGNDFSVLEKKIVEKPADLAKELQTNFKNSKVLRGEFTQATKEFASINDSYGRINVSAKDPSPAGDLSLIFNYMKMLDPESVVRESEFATAAATGSYGDRMQNVVNKIVTGEKLTAKQRADFVGRAKKLYNEAARIHKGRVAEFSKKAEQFDIDPSQVIFERQFHEKGAVQKPATEVNIQSLVDKYAD